MGDFWRRLLKAALLCVIVLALSACGGGGGGGGTNGIGDGDGVGIDIGDDSDGDNDGDGHGGGTGPTTITVSGVAQKGPLLAGGILSAFQLIDDSSGLLIRDQEVSATLGNHGAYELQIPWHGPTEFEVSGRYYDELNGLESSQHVTLQAFADITADTRINLNLFTTLLHQRMQQLLTEMNFATALVSANEDLGTLLGLVWPDERGSESLDLTNGEDDALVAANTSLLLFSAAVLKLHSDDDNEDGGLPRLERLLQDFADDGHINGDAFLDWEDIINAGTPELLEEARNGLSEGGIVGALPDAPLPPWAGKLLVSLHEAVIQRNEVTSQQEMHVSVRLSARPRSSVRVQFRIEPITANEGDYEAPQLERDLVVFERGEQVRHVIIPLPATGSGKPEKPQEPKTIRLLLKEPDGAELGRSELIAAIPPETLPVRNDFRLNSFELLRLRDGSRQLPLDGKVLYSEASGMLTAQLELKSSIDCPDFDPTRLNCLGADDFRYFVEIDLISGDQTLHLGEFQVTPKEIVVRGTLVDPSTAKTINLLLGSAEFNAFVASAADSNTPLEFRATARVVPTRTLKTSAPQLQPYKDQLGFGGVKSGNLNFGSLVEDNSCRGHPSTRTSWRISGTSDWQPASDGSWASTSLSYTDLCVELRQDRADNGWYFGVLNGEVQIDRLSGQIGGLTVIAEDNVLDRQGARPAQISIQLPAGHSWHSADANGRPTPRGSQTILSSLDPDYYFSGDYSTLTADISGGFIHARGLPFSLQATSLSLDGYGLHGQVGRLHYNFDQAYRLDDSRHLSKQGPVSNDARFAQPSSGQSGFTIDNDGLHISEINFAPGSARTHFPRTKLQWEAPFVLAVEAGRLQNDQALPHGDRYRFDFAGNCGGCIADGAAATSYQLTATNASGLTSDGAVAARVAGLEEPAWGPHDAASDRRIFLRQGDSNHNGIFYLPGLLAQGSSAGWVVDYLLGARSLTATGSALMPATLYPRNHPQTRRGNHFTAGLTVGPEIYSDASQAPQALLGSDLNGNSISIGFGGLPAPSYRTIYTNSASKYVVRPGGLTGVFNSNVGPGQVTAYGYDISLRRFAVRLINNQLDEYNWLDGSVSIPGKGGFDISFSSLELSCSGDVGAGLIDREICGDGIDNNSNGVVDENCAMQLAGWQTPAQLLSMSFKPQDPAAGMCVAQPRLLEVGQSLEVRKLSKPLGLLGFWSPGGDLLEHSVRSAGDLQIDRPMSSDSLDGFALALAATQLKTPTNSDTEGWFQFHGRIGVPFWEALKVDGRVANTDSTVLVAQGSLSEAADAYSNSRFLNEGIHELYWDDELNQDIEYNIQAAYRWGNTGWGFDLPVFYDYQATDRGHLPRFLGHQQNQDLLVLTAKAGINFIDPIRTRVSFGASSDFSRLRDASVALDLQVDLSDPDSLKNVDKLLNKVGVRGTPLTDSLGSLHDKLDLMNSLVGPALDSAIKRVLLEAIIQAGAGLGSGDPFQQLADAMSLVQTLPAQVANTVGDQLSEAMDQATAPLTGALDRTLVNLYQEVPAILSEAPDNPSEAFLNKARGYLEETRHAYRALDSAYATVTKANAGLEDARAQLTALGSQIGSWTGDINQALGQIQNNVLTQQLRLGDCQFVNVSTGISSHNALIGPAVDSMVKTKEVASLLRDLQLAEWVGQYIATAAGLDPQPMINAEKQIRDLAIALEQRVNEVLQTAQNTLCPGAGDTPLASSLAKANSFLNNIRTGLQSIDAHFDILQTALNTAIDHSQAKLQSVHDGLDNGRTFLAELESTLQAVIDVEHPDYKGWAVAEIQAVMDATAQQAFGLPWYDPVKNHSFVATLSRNLRAPVDDLIAEVQLELQLQLATIAAHVPVKSADELRRLVINHILDTPPVQQLLVAVNGQLAAIVGDLNGLVLLVLDQVNHLVQTAAREVEAAVNTALAAATSKLDGGLPITSANMDGYAVISGEELERAHLSAEWTMRGASADNSVSYNAALDITSWNANGKSEGCEVAAGPYAAPMDAIISTRNLPIRISSDDVLIRKLYLGFTLENLVPMGLFGGIDTQGDLSFQTFTLYDIGFAAGTGAYENYIGATANATFTSLQMSAAFLVGKTCNREVIESLDPQVGKFITLPGDIFNGAYVRGSASIPVWDMGCALRIGVSADVGSWVLASPTLTVGGLVGGGAYGKVACLGALRGQVTALGEMSGGTFSFAGEGFGVAGAGLSCKPETWTTVARSRQNSWCGTVDASFGARYSNGWQIDGLNFSGIH